ncbi:Anamorsin [Spraguea lophii 42_110]|uniref:Anamorsin n=1 Tax=Spraguea lophii (strain 42_110) TaxID=1358809 RepID=S7W7F9_SPRLO|nr:Anamorsin [Spraguea lophii 42_110]
MGEKEDLKKLLERAISEPKSIDDDEFLTEKDKAPKENGGCGSQQERKRNPCAGCSCGAADGKDEVKDFKSSCGSCYLGDAFRCSGCPYIGMPAFDPGEEVYFSDSSEE